MTENACRECGAAGSDPAQSQCARCGAVHPPSPGRKRGGSRPSENPTPVAKGYAAVLIFWALLFPFLVPIILKVSRMNL